MLGGSIAVEDLVRLPVVLLLQLGLLITAVDATAGFGASADRDPAAQCSGQCVGPAGIRWDEAPIDWVGERAP
jgi:hypothetical protein